MMPKQVEFSLLKARTSFCVLYISLNKGRGNWFLLAVLCGYSNSKLNLLTNAFGLRAYQWKSDTMHVLTYMHLNSLVTSASCYEIRWLIIAQVSYVNGLFFF